MKNKSPEIIYGAKVDPHLFTSHGQPSYASHPIQETVYPQQNVNNPSHAYNPGYYNEPRPVIHGQNQCNAYSPTNNYPTHYSGNDTSHWNNTHDKPAYGQNYSDNPNLLNNDMDIRIRHGFIRKVYGILMTQLILTFLIMFFIINVHPVAEFLLRYTFIFYIAIVLQLAIVIGIVCCDSVGRKFPTNYILLAIYSFFQGIILSYLAIRVSSVALYTAIGLTIAVTLALTLFACQTRIDFTGCGAFVLVCAVILIGCSIVGIFFRSRIFHVIVSGVGCLVASFYIIYDTQLIVGGKRRSNQMSIDDYAYAALALYSDIILLFISILSLSSNVSNE